MLVDVKAFRSVLKVIRPAAGDNRYLSILGSVRILATAGASFADILASNTEVHARIRIPLLEPAAADLDLCADIKALAGLLAGSGEAVLTSAPDRLRVTRGASTTDLPARAGEDHVASPMRDVAPKRGPWNLPAGALGEAVRRAGGLGDPDSCREGLRGPQFGVDPSFGIYVGSTDGHSAALSRIPGDPGATAWRTTLPAAAAALLPGLPWEEVRAEEHPAGLLFAAETWEVWCTTAASGPDLVDLFDTHTRAPYHGTVAVRTKDLLSACRGSSAASGAAQAHLKPSKREPPVMRVEPDRYQVRLADVLGAFGTEIPAAGEGDLWGREPLHVNPEKLGRILSCVPSEEVEILFGASTASIRIYSPPHVPRAEQDRYLLMPVRYRPTE